MLIKAALVTVEGWGEWVQRKERCNFKYIALGRPLQLYRCLLKVELDAAGGRGEKLLIV